MIFVAFSSLVLGVIPIKDQGVFALKLYNDVPVSTETLYAQISRYISYMPWWVELELGRNREVRREVLKTRCFQSRVRRLYYL